MATASQAGLCIRTSSPIVSTHVALPQRMWQAVRCSPRAWRKPWRPTFGWNVSGKQRSHGLGQENGVSFLFMADVSHSVPSADHSEPELILGVDEDREDNSLIFKYGTEESKSAEPCFWATAGEGRVQAQGSEDGAVPGGSTGGSSLDVLSGKAVDEWAPGGSARAGGKGGDEGVPGGSVVASSGEQSGVQGQVWGAPGGSTGESSLEVPGDSLVASDGEWSGSQEDFWETPRGNTGESRVELPGGSVVDEPGGKVGLVRDGELPGGQDGVWEVPGGKVGVPGGSVVASYRELADGQGGFWEVQGGSMGSSNGAYATNGAAAEEREQYEQVKALSEGDMGGAIVEGNQETGFVAKALNDLKGEVCEIEKLEDGEVEVNCPLRFETGVAVIPHPSKAQRGGEDAHFMEGNWLGVADGVSSWAELGVNSGLYSRELMWNCLDVVRSGEVGPAPTAVLEESHGRTDLQGSCTAVVAVLDGQTLRVANLGDSGFAVVRGRQVALQSRPMRRAFNIPFQVGTSGGDDPQVAEEYLVELQGGDVVLLGTDGLFDNVFPDAIVQTLALARAEGKGPEVAAKQLAQVAQKQSVLTTGSTPFREEARAAGQQFDGGKMDDITVVVAYVT